jgi:hypothetical protein
MHSEEILRPIIGQWYYDRANDREFEILNIDKEEGIIELQYLEGEKEEIELESWEDLNLAKIAEPVANWDEEEDDDKDDFDDLEELDEDDDDDDWDTDDNDDWGN